MLGVKMYGGEWCQPGNIVMRQRGTEFHPGHGMGMVRQSATTLRAPPWSIACSRRRWFAEFDGKAGLYAGGDMHAKPAVEYWLPTHRAEITRCSPWSPAM